MTDHLKALEKAKMHLMMKPNTVFYTTILFSLKQQWKTEIPTAATDGINLFINPNWFNSLIPEERIGLLAHEILHVALNHMTRKGDRDHKLWNKAGDYVINNLLSKNGYTLPKGGLLDSSYNDKSTEQVYKILYDKASKNPDGSLKNDTIITGIGNDIIYPVDKESKKEIENKITDNILRAAIQAKEAGDNPGSIPGDILIQVEKVINPKLPWNILLQNYMQNFAKEDYSMRRINKKYLPNFYLPSLYSDSLSNITIAVDASGSALHAFNHYISEINYIKENLNPEKITLIVFDTKIQSIQSIKDNTNLMKDVKFTGGGGTYITPVLDWIEQEKPEITLIFTDGYFTKINKKLSNNIIWVINNNLKFKTSFGKIIHYDIKETS